MSIRKMAFAGSFYPDSKEELDKYIDYFNGNLNPTLESMKARAMIAPHAGYVYSGFTANVAYKLQESNVKRVIVIGPSHRSYIKGASISLFDEYETPYGNLKIDLDYAKALKEEFEFVGSNPAVHVEHSTETQMPFIKNYMSDVEVIEIIYGDLAYEELAELMMKLFEDDDNFLVISTDLSHFYSLEEANALDSICLEAIEQKNLSQFDEGCEACGMVGVKAVISCSIKKGFNVKLLHYCTSYDASGDKDKVVGYVSALIGV